MVCLAVSHRVHVDRKSLILARLYPLCATPNSCFNTLVQSYTILTFLILKGLDLNHFAQGFPVINLYSQWHGNPIRKDISLPSAWHHSILFSKELFRSQA